MQDNDSFVNLISKVDGPQTVSANQPYESVQRVQWRQAKMR